MNEELEKLRQRIRDINKEKRETGKVTVRPELAPVNEQHPYFLEFKERMAALGVDVYITTPEYGFEITFSDFVSFVVSSCSHDGYIWLEKEGDEYKWR